MDVVKHLVEQCFSTLSYEEKLRIKDQGRPLPDLVIEVLGSSRGKSYTRRFNKEIYNRNNWICGCNNINALFCFPCLLFGGENVWTKTGVNDLVHLTEKIKKHESSKIHLNNQNELSLLGTVNVQSQLNSAYWTNIQKHNENVTKNRYVLCKIINCIKFCGAFELAMRGHDETEDSSNPGIFRGLIDFTADLDQTLRDHLQGSSQQFKGTSKTIQNELLDSMLAVTQEEISRELDKARFVAIMADETTDNSSKFQMVLVLRNIDDGLGGRLDARNTAGKIAGRFRTALPQVLASTANNLILLDLGMTLAFPTIVIPALHHRAVDLSLSDEQASWLGSIPFICQPLGSVLSGLILQPLGRKRSMLLVNAPQLIGWLMLHWANSHAMLFTATVIMGLGVGFMEAPIITYVGEISQPKLRGILTSYSGLFAQMGFALEYLLGTVTPWRTAAAISAAVPIVTAVAITQVPETPMWLLSRGRVLEAQASLQWLRGWVSADAVRDEFLQMQRYQEEARREHERIKAKTSGRRASRSSETFSAEDDAANMSRVLTERHRGSQHWPVPIPVDGDAAKGRRPSQRELDEMLLEEEEACCGRETACSRRMADLYRPQTLRPMVLITALFFFMHAVGLSGIRPFMVEVVTELGISLDAHWTTVLSAVIGIGGNILCMLLVAWCGKRPLTLVSLAGCAVSSLLLGGYIWAGRDIGQWAPLTLFIALSFCHSFGIAPVPWMMISEVFPFRTRGLASGITAAVSYVLGFVAARTFLPLHAALGLHGVLWLYGALTILGLAVLCYAMPETEGRSLEDIERRFGGQRHAPDHRLGAVIADIAALTEAPLKTGGGSLETELGGVKKQAASVETLVTECSSSSAADLTEGKSAAEPTAAEDAVKLNGNSAKNGKGSFRKTKPASPKLDGDARQTLGESLKQVDPYKPVVDTTNMT